MRPIIHPGEILAEEFVKPKGLSVERLAKDIHVPLTLMRKVIEGSASVCADLAMRLSLYFGTSERFWLEIQMSYDLDRVRRRRSHLRAEITPLAA